MRFLYTSLKYLAVVLWSTFVIAPFLWAVSTSFKDFQSVTSGATYIPWVDFEPNLEGWRALWELLLHMPCHASPLRQGLSAMEI